MKPDGYWQNFSSGHKIFLGFLVLNLIVGLLVDEIGIIYLSLLAIVIYSIIQGARWRELKRKASQLSQEKPPEEAKKTILLFEKPVTGDWLFWVFSVILSINVLSGVSNVVNSGGLVFSYGGIISGLLDGLFTIVLSWFPLIPIIYLVRKLIRKLRKSGSNAPE